MKKGIVGPVSLSGTLALVAIADKEEFEQAATNLFESVWEKEILFEKRDNTNKENARAVSNAFSVLKSLHPHIAKSHNFTTNDCGNLLQHILNKCTTILRASKHALNTKQNFGQSHILTIIAASFYRERRTHTLQIENVANPTDNGRRVCSESMASHV